MDSSIVIAIIGGIATIAAAMIGILPVLGRWRQSTAIAGQANSVVAARPNVYFQGAPHRFLNFGGKNCRIEALDGSPSFLAPTHEIFHDSNCTRRITRDSIVP